MATVQELILAKLDSMEKKLDIQGQDLAVLKSQHDSGNSSERVAAWSAVIAVLVSVVGVATACGIANGNKPHEKVFIPRPIGNSVRVPRDIRPKKESVPDKHRNL